MENWNQLIERYLLNELTEDARLAFEKELATNPALQKELALHRLVHQAAQRAMQRTQIQQTGKMYHLVRKLVIGAIAAVVIGAISLGIYLFATKSNRETETDQQEIQTEVVDQLLKKVEFEGITPQIMQWDGEDSVFLSQSGVLLSIPEGCLTKNGKPYTGKALISWQEATHPSDIMQAGLSTTSGDRLLETQGMFSFKAFTPEGQTLELHPEKSIYVQVPVDEIKEGMKLFTAQKGPNGQLDWVNPQELEKIPVPVDMDELNFYPPGYEKRLDQLQWQQGRKKRDCLYLSFENEYFDVGDFNLYVNEYEAVPSGKNSPAFSSQPEIPEFRVNREKGKVRVSCSYDRIDAKTLNLHCEIQLWEGFGIRQSSLKLQSVNLKEFPFASEPDIKGMIYRLPNGNSYYVGKIKIEEMISVQAGKKSFTIPLQVTGDLVDGRNPTVIAERVSQLVYVNVDEEPIETENLADSVYYIRPSKVLGFWNKKMNNTILATREFEARMKAIHGTCTEAVLDVYLNNLNEPLWKLDQRVAAMGYPQFETFAAERVGALKQNNEHLENLRNFMQNAINDLRKRAEADQSFAAKLEQQIEERVMQLRTADVERKTTRDKKVLKEEYEYNLADVGRQLGKTLGFQMHGGGTVVNIDKYVWDATVNRTTTVITDPETGKKAKITYNPFGLTVGNSDPFDRLYMYVLPYELNSFHRIDPVGKKFEFPLNGALRYNLAVIGINEKGYYLYQANNITQKELGTVQLKAVEEAEFRRILTGLNQTRNASADEITTELDWLKSEQHYAVHQLKKREMAKFRNKIRRVVYPCFDDAAIVNTQ